MGRTIKGTEMKTNKINKEKLDRGGFGYEPKWNHPIIPKLSPIEQSRKKYMTEEESFEHCKNSKYSNFIITNMDTLRDGGTNVIHTNYGEYYISRDNRELHTNYPLTKLTLVRDELVIKYMMYRIDYYQYTLKLQMNKIQELLKGLTKKEKLK